MVFVIGLLALEFDLIRTCLSARRKGNVFIPGLFFAIGFRWVRDFHENDREAPGGLR